MKQHEKLMKITLASVLTALTTTATLLIQIPTPSKGYLNLGDCLVNVSAWILGPVYGMAAAGLGSALADIISGYLIYAPFTLVIKALMAVISFQIYQKFSQKLQSIPARMLSACLAELVMILGYALTEVCLYQSWAAGFAGIPGNLVQGIAGAASSVAVYELIVKRIPHLNSK